MTISDRDAPLEELGGRRGALRSAVASVGSVRRHMAARSWAAHPHAPEAAIDSPAGSAGGMDLLLASVGESDNVLQQTLRTLGVVQQRSLADFLG